MSCSGCSSGRGCGTVSKTLPGGCRNNGACGTGGCNKMGVFNWLANMELPAGQTPFDIVEIRFKNSRKEFFRNVNNLPLQDGDVVAVESSPGHDIGIVSLCGELVKMQMNRKGVSTASPDIKKVYRKAKQSDIDKWVESQGREFDTMHKARSLALGLKLEMKISDVEYQGDGTKAIFYYTADARVDFRELIKKMADQFKIRIEMRQIGARQEASRLGGIGSCGRELCCSTWLSDFRSVTTGAARYQQLSLNPLKLAGQCGKLKCCLNYELDTYLDALKDFPSQETRLQSKAGTAFHFKTDIFKRLMWYAYDGQFDNPFPLTVDKVNSIISMNSKGELPEELKEQKPQEVKVKQPDYENVVGQDSITRFDRSKNQHRNKKRKGHNRNRKNNNPNRKNENKQD